MSSKLRSLLPSPAAIGAVSGCLALFISLGGVGFAANIARSISGAQIKRGSIQADRLSARARALLRGQKGAQGTQGLQGIQGTQGAAGQNGSPDTPAQVLAKTEQVDGSGSGLDADLIDGIDASSLVSTSTTAGGDLTGTYPAPLIKGWRFAGNAGTSPPTDFLGTTDAQPLVIKTNGNERMRVDASGNVGIGTSPVTLTGGPSLVVSGPLNAGAGNGSNCDVILADDTCFFDEQNGTLSVRNSSGSSYAGVKASAFTVSSTVAVKKDIVPLTSADDVAQLRSLDALPLFRFRYDNEREWSPPHTGVLAELAPAGIVSADGKAVNLYDYIGFLAGATKALSAKTARLEGEVRALRRRRAASP